MTLKEYLDMHISRWEEHARKDTPYINGMIDAFNLLSQTLPEWSLCMDLSPELLPMDSEGK